MLQKHKACSRIRNVTVYDSKLKRTGRLKNMIKPELIVVVKKTAEFIGEKICMSTEDN